MTKVSISRCDGYNEEKLDKALDSSLEKLGGMTSFVTPGQKVLLKVNALMPAEPDSAIPTHPLFVKCVAKQVMKAGAVPFIGDSPGGVISDINKIYERIGYSKIAHELGIETVNFQSSGALEVPAYFNKLLPKLSISKNVLGFDRIINLPKLKTHALTRFTGAIKNCFGCVPGFHKSQFHFIAPDPYDFSILMADIFSIIKPCLNIMDAVIGMEGNGPSAGRPKKVGLVLASSDGVSLDSVASNIIGFDPLEIMTTQIAFEKGLGEARLDKIDLCGENLSDIRTNFKKPVNVSAFTKYIPGPVYSLAKLLLKKVRIDPVIDPEKCTACRTCANNCPAKCINIVAGKEYKIDYNKCIMCYCCSELCPYQAIEIKSSLLARLFFGAGK